MKLVLTEEQAKFILETAVDKEVDERSRSFAFTRKRRLFSKSEMMANPDRYKHYDKEVKGLTKKKKHHEELSETRHSYLSFIVTKVKELTGEDWPEYVLRDWLYQNTKNLDPENDTPNGYKKLVYRFVRDFVGEYGRGRWEYKVIELGFDSFSQDTKSGLESRHNSTVPFKNVPNDIERHKTQQNLIQKRGVSKEPIILVQRNDGYELIEGWHRTIQSLERFTRYEQSAYVYIPY